MTPTYCLVPAELASELHDLLRRHFRDDPSMRVVIDRRRLGNGNGRGRMPRSVAHAGDRRAAFADVEAPRLPRRARRHAKRLAFIQRTGPQRPQHEDEEDTRLVVRAQQGDSDAFAALYSRYFHRILSYVRMGLRDRHEAEDLAQQVFLKALRSLDTYEVAPGRSFRPWLFRISRNQLLDHLAKHSPTLLEDTDHIGNEATADAADIEAVRSTLSWMTESEVAILIRRLPMAQRQVVTLRYVIGLSLDEVADVLERSPGSISMLDHRARQYLQMRLSAMGRRPVVARSRGFRALAGQARVLRDRRFALRWGPTRR